METRPINPPFDRLMRDLREKANDVLKHKRRAGRKLVENAARLSALLTTIEQLPRRGDDFGHAAFAVGYLAGYAQLLAVEPALRLAHKVEKPKQVRREQMERALKKRNAPIRALFIKLTSGTEWKRHGMGLDKSWNGAKPIFERLHDKYSEVKSRQIRRIVEDLIPEAKARQL